MNSPSTSNESLKVKILISNLKICPTICFILACDLSSRTIYCVVVVVSIGVNHTFKVIFTPLEYNLTMSKRPTFLVWDFFFLIYIINVCVVLFKRNEGLQTISSAFLTAQGRKFIDIYIYKDYDKNTNSTNGDYCSNRSSLFHHYSYKLKNKEERKEERKKKKESINFATKIWLSCCFKCGNKGNQKGEKKWKIKIIFWRLDGNNAG